MDRKIRTVFALFAAAFLAASAIATELSWSDNSTNEDGFEVQRRESESEGWKVVAQVAADVAAYSDSAVRFGVSYEYRVRAFNEWGYSGYTNVVVHVPALRPIDEIPSGTPPQSPSNATALDRIATALEAISAAITTPQPTNSD